MRLIRPGWSGGNEVVENQEHVLVVSHLFVTSGIFLVRVLIWDLIEHGCEEHIESSVSLDQFFEFLDDWLELFWVIVDMVNHPAKPLLLDTMILRLPCTRAE